jgi:hypothetical protein
MHTSPLSVLHFKPVQEGAVAGHSAQRLKTVRMTFSSSSTESVFVRKVGGKVQTLTSARFAGRHGGHYGCANGRALDKKKGSSTVFALTI